MALFKRNKTTTNQVPAEVKEYYQSEHRERVGLAWLIAFLSLILTIAVVAGLFFGGRWIYRQITKDDAVTPPTSQEGTGSPSEAPSGSQNTPSQPNDLQPAAPSQNQNTGTSSTNTDTNTPSSSSSSSSTPSTSSQANITNTGPADTLAIFLGSTVLATVAHLAYQRRKQQA